MNVVGRRRINWLRLGMLLMGGLILGAVVHQTRSQIQPNQAPFTARYTETSTNTLTSRTLQKPLLFIAVRSDGVTSSGSLDQQIGFRLIKDRHTKREVTVNDFLRLKTTLDYGYIPFTPPRRALSPDCRPDASGFTALGSEMIVNHQAYR